MPRSLLALKQLVFIAGILVYFVGSENARKHWIRVAVYVVSIWIVWCWLGTLTQSTWREIATFLQTVHI